MRVPRRVALVSAVCAAFAGLPVVAYAAPPAPATVSGPAEGWTNRSHWHLNGDGMVTRTFYGPPAFRHRGNTWVAIDPVVRPTTKPAAPLAAENALRPVRFGTRNDRIVEIALDRGSVVLSAPGLTSGTPRLDGGDVVYRDVAPQTDLRYRVTAEGVKEELVLRGPAAPRTFTFHLADPRGLLGTASRTVDGGYAFGANAADGNALRLLPAVAQAAGDDGPRPDSAAMTVVPAGDGWDVTQSVDASWAAGRTYPIVLDPSMTFSSATGAVDCSLMSALWTLTSYCGSSPLYVGYVSDQQVPGHPYARRALFSFDVSTLPADAVVDSASLNVVAEDSTGTQYEVRQPGASWTSSATWLTRDGMTPWSNAGGDPGTTVYASANMGLPNGTTSFASAALGQQAHDRRGGCASWD
jgi:hypothetical protein